VMFGMTAAAEIARARGLISSSDTARQNVLLLRAGMSCNVRGIFPGEILEAMKLDKKVIGGKIRFVLPGCIGNVDVYSDVGENEMLHGINYMLEFCGKI